jgi:hypothetical protein
MHRSRRALIPGRFKYSIQIIQTTSRLDLRCDSQALAISGRCVSNPACCLMGGAMHWLMLLAGIALPIMTSAQSRFQAQEPDYAQGYERPDSARTDWPWLDPGQRRLPDDARPGHGEVFAPWTDRVPAPEAGATPAYRFRGDPPPSAGGTQAVEPDSDPRFRPLTSRERERLGPSTRWRPSDEERRGGPYDPEP